MNTLEQEYDIVVIGGGTAGPMAAIKAKEHDRELRVLLVDKANVKRSGAISMGMDGLNNAIVPGHATAEQYTREITVANDASSTRRRSTPMPATASRPCGNWIAGASGSKRTRPATMR